MAGARLNAEERLSRIVAIQREIADAGNDLQVVMQRGTGGTRRGEAA